MNTSIIGAVDYYLLSTAVDYDAKGNPNKQKTKEYRKQAEELKNSLLGIKLDKKDKPTLTEEEKAKYQTAYDNLVKKYNLK